MADEDVRAEFKGTSVRGQMKDMAQQVYAIEWVRLDPEELLCSVSLQKVGEDPEDYEVIAIEFLN
jgi:hypothetical protein